MRIMHAAIWDMSIAPDARHRLLSLIICDLGVKDTQLVPLLLHQVASFRAIAAWLMSCFGSCGICAMFLCGLRRLDSLSGSSLATTPRRPAQRSPCALFKSINWILFTHGTTLQQPQHRQGRVQQDSLGPHPMVGIPDSLFFLVLTQCRCLCDVMSTCGLRDVGATTYHIHPSDLNLHRQECGYCKWRREMEGEDVIAGVTEPLYRQLEYLLYNSDSLAVRNEVCTAASVIETGLTLLA